MKLVLVLALAIGFAVVPACVCGSETPDTSTTPRPLGSNARPQRRVQLMKNLPVVPRASISAAAPAAPSATASAQ